MSFWRKVYESLPGGFRVVAFAATKRYKFFRSQNLAGISLRIEASDNVRTQLSLSDVVNCSPGFVNTCPDLSNGLRFLHESGIAGCRQRKPFVDTQQYIIHCLPGTLFHLQQSENAIVNQHNCGKI